MQDEEYLDDIDFDEIRRYDILKKIGEFNPNMNIPKNHQQWMKSKPEQPYKKRLKSQRFKQQLDASKYGDIGDFDFNKYHPAFAESYTKVLKRSKRGCPVGQIWCTSSYVSCCTAASSVTKGSTKAQYFI